MRNLFLLVLVAFFGLNLAAQQVTSKHFKIVPPESCQGSADKKAQKFLDEGKDRKTDKDDRIQALKKAIEIDPECSEAHYFLGLEYLKAGGNNLKAAEKEIAEAVRICPDFHFHPYYFLATLNLNNGDFAKAVEYYKKYYEISGSHEDPLDDALEEEIKLDYNYAKFYADAYANPVPFAPSLVGGICTDMDEFLPLVAPDNESMWITRKYKEESLVRDGSFNPETETLIDKFVEAKHSANGFLVGEPLSAPFNVNKDWNYGGASITIDNKNLYLTICKPASGGYRNCDIYSSNLKYGYNPKNGQTEYFWSELKNLGDSVNTKDGWEAQPSISSDGNTLYFASARAGSRGIDIFYATKKKDGSWSQAKPLPEPINTDGNDKTPFMHSDSRTLYFASDGHMGFGGYDVFLARQNDDGTWTKPKNIGHPINTEQDEQAFAVSTDGKRVYYSGKDPKAPRSIDIYSFELYKEARPEKVVFVKGNLTDETGNVPKNATIELKSMESKNVSQVKVDKSDGAYAAVIRVKENENVVMNVKAENVAFQSQLIETKPETQNVRTSEDEEEESTIQTVELKVETAKPGGVYKINDIYYNTNSADISEKSKYILDEFALYLIENKSIKITIQGHTDNVGNANANLALSTDRAFSVKQYLESKGVSGARIQYQGFGSAKPIADNNSAEGRAQNRRTEFVITAL